MSNLPESHHQLSQKIMSLETSSALLLQESHAALNTIDRRDITELKCIRLPHEAIIKIIKAVAYLEGYNGSGDWEEVKQYLFDPSLLSNLANLHQNFNLTNEIKENFCSIAYKPGFDARYLATFSNAASRLYLWADSFFKYSEQIQELNRLKEQLQNS
ncbi:hypothetical protein SteCoe_13996 [Stentor coeruleus]|uniref:Uncharacterized protein n=1 Tax=Stentor coeruleus TaxID=5963 RepID=A0A1R2C739_9CILI|nr:hypothetical protein SteCoe_13996 [Stentor coeruleus]